MNVELLPYVVIPTAVATALITSFIAWLVAERQMGYAWRLQEERLRREFRIEFMAEQAARSLLEHPKWKMRSFAAIQKRLGGFDENELRKLLVRAGAVRFSGKNNEELWGLLSKNPERLEDSD